MTQAYNALSAYQAAAKMTSSLGAVVMLYDGMIKEVKKAKEAVEEGRIEDRFNATQKACRILLGLQSHLDFEKGGDVSLMLDQFYHTIFRDLQSVNMKNSSALCDDIVRALSEVRASWAELADNERRTGSPDGSGKKPAPSDDSEPQVATSVTLSI
ncbi:flagellar export chaperone FliS [Pelagibius sp. 7325]|uniref:flagellar export chaperone FliS n=1 Tax=Pelagibius sp. 7325 TaxID=3131994 RepID=UPI0030ECCF95